MSTQSLNYTYIYFDVHDYTNSSVLSSYTLNSTPLTFIPDFTTSAILSGAQNISSKALRWEFGDGSFSTDLSPSHVYQWPGEYNVTLTVYDGSGNAYDSTFTSTVRIFDFIATQISFEDYKSLIYDIPVGKLIDPLTINAHFSWQNYRTLSASGYTINLYASGAQGSYNYIAKEQNDKWSHLRSLSRFYTLSTINGFTDYITIESIQPTITEIYANIQDNQLQLCQSTDLGSELVGVTGSCQFWYTDDIPANLLTNSNPIIIFASIDNTKFKDAFTQITNAYEYISYPPYGYQNIDSAVFPSIKTRYNPADHLSITTTGIDGEGNPVDQAFDIPYISWQNTEIPYVIKFKDNENFTTKNYPSLSSSIVHNSTITPQPFYDVQTGIVYESDSGLHSLSGVTFYEDFVSQAPQSIGAFYKGYFISQQSTENCYLTASINVIDPPYYLKDALINWIAIPQYNSALRILKQDNYNGFNDSLSISFNNSSFYQINSNNTYAITVAPSGATADSDYRTWFADPVGDQLLQYDIYGNLLTTYALSGMVTLVNNLTSRIDYRSPISNGVSRYAAPNDIALDSNNNIWVTLLDSGLAIKIDSATGFVTTVASPSGNNFYTLSSDYLSLSGYSGESLFLPSSIDTDLDNNIWIAYSHPDYSTLIKYQGTNNFTISANIINTVYFPAGISPEQIQVDRNGFVWATTINHNSNGVGFSNRNDYLYKFDTNGNLIPGYPLSGFQQIGNLTIDGNQNAWVVQRAETLTKVDGVSGTMTNYVAGLGNNTTDYICSIGGITCDTSNNIWVINNFDNNLYVIDAGLQTTGVLNSKYIIPLTYPNTSLPAVTAYAIDSDAATFIAQAGITDNTAKIQLNAFVLGVKALGLWNNMVAWPLRSTQNANGLIAYSLGGLGSYPATFPSTPPVWTPDGLYTSQFSQYGISNATVSDFSRFTMGTFYKLIDVNYQFSIGNTGAPVCSFCGWGGGGKSTYISADGSTGNSLAIDFPEASSNRLFIDTGVHPDGSSIGIIATKDGYTSTGYVYTASSTPTIGTKVTSLSADGTGSPFYLLSRQPNFASRYIAQRFIFIFDKTLTLSDANAFYSLYTTTLGSSISGFGTGSAPVTPTPNVYSDGLKEFQAYGDWNGYNWLNKYAAPVSTIRTITGSSSLFNINPNAGQFNIAKVNEGWDASGYYDSLRFQETLLDKQVFFDQFLGVIVGKLDAQPYELGKTVYEKIANFVDNNADIDKVNINELLSFCNELSVEFEHYNVTLPPQLRRLVDLLSIKQSKLWGTANKYNTNFDPQGTSSASNDYGINLGNTIDPITGVCINGTPIVAQELFSGSYKLVNTNIITDYNIGDIIPLSSYTPNWGWGLVAPDITGSKINNYYTFYNYNPVFNNTYYDNIINWTDPYTTLLPTNSSYNGWRQDNGIMQSLLSYELTKGFRLFTSAANITYNS